MVTIWTEETCLFGSIQVCRGAEYHYHRDFVDISVARVFRLRSGIEHRQERCGYL